MSDSFLTQVVLAGMIPDPKGDAERRAILTQFVKYCEDILHNKTPPTTPESFYALYERFIEKVWCAKAIFSRKVPPMGYAPAPPVDMLKNMMDFIARFMKERGTPSVTFADVTAGFGYHAYIIRVLSKIVFGEDVVRVYVSDGNVTSTRPLETDKKRVFPQEVEIKLASEALKDLDPKTTILFAAMLPLDGHLEEEEEVGAEDPGVILVEWAREHRVPLMLMDEYAGGLCGTSAMYAILDDDETKITKLGTCLLEHCNTRLRLRVYEY